GAGRCARHPGRRRGLRRRGRRLGHGPAGGVHRAGPAARLRRRRRRWCPLAARLPRRAGVRLPGAEHPPARPGRDGRPRPVARRLPRRAARRASGRRAARLIPRSAAPVGRSHLYRSRSTPMTLVLTELPAAAQEAVAATRELVAALHAELPRNDLVVWTAGNVSERVPTTDPEVPGLLVIKPSGVSYDELSAVNMVVCTLAGAKLADGTPDALTAEFGGPVTVGPFAVIGDDSIGRGIVETLQGHRSPAVLMQNHGPFTIGKDARAAVKAAVMVEEVARTVHVSRQLGEPLPIEQ